MSKPLKIIFAGTPPFAANTLQALLNSSHEIIAVYTQPDRRSGRGKKITSSAVKQVASQHNIAVYQPINFKDQAELTQLATLNADIMVIVAYGIILPQSVLDIPPLGCINVHASVLPRWRGAAPIERALLAGDRETGITIMQMDKGLDTGDILSTQTLKINSNMTSMDLQAVLNDMGSDLLLNTLDDISSGIQTPTQQDNDKATYAEKLHKSEGKINWQQTSAEIALKIRGLNPRPVAFSTLNDQTIRIWSATQLTDITDHSITYKPGTILNISKKGIEVSCLDQSRLLIRTIQLPGGKQLSIEDVINSRKDLFRIGAAFISTNETNN